MNRIGVPQSGYNVDRNIPQLAEFQRLRPWDWNRLLTAVEFRLRGQLSKKLQFSWSGPSWPRVDLLHFFNSVSLSSTPWVTTYEDIIPRWWGSGTPDEVRQALQAILSDSCRGVIGFSEATERVAGQFFQENGLGPQWEQIKHKRYVLHPPQPLFEPSERSQECIRFCFVGGDFYRKGGLEVLKAFDSLDSTWSSTWKLTIIGRLGSWGDYASHTTEKAEVEAREMISRNSENIAHFEAKPNPDVLALFKESHYLMFPTFQDTYGYAVLEAMASGCVPIVSATRVFPEIIEHRKNGLLVELPTDASGDAHRTATTPAEKRNLVHRLQETLLEVFDNHGQAWPKWSEASRQRIALYHDPEKHRNALKEIYQKAIQSEFRS